MSKLLTPRERSERLQAWLMERPESLLEEDFLIHAEAEIRGAVREAALEHRRFQRQANATITRIERKLGKLERTGYPLADRLAALKAFVSIYARCSNCQRESGHESWCPYRRDDGSDAYAIMREARAVLSGRPWQRKK